MRTWVSPASSETPAFGSQLFVMANGLPRPAQGRPLGSAPRRTHGPHQDGPEGLAVHVHEVAHHDGTVVVGGIDSHVGEAGVVVDPAPATVGPHLLDALA